MSDFLLKNPWCLLGLLVIPLLVWLRWRRGIPALIVPFAAAWWKPVLVPATRVPAMLITAGLLLLVVALARPQKMEVLSEVRQEGYDIVLAIDLSGSMLAEDYENADGRLNRLQAIKPVIQAFISDRPNDRIGLVVFAGKAYTLAPLTFDHPWLARQTERLRVGMMEDGTAIGDGIGVALTRLEKPKTAKNANNKKGSFIVLLTDGSNNKGTLKPQQATEIAKSRGVTIYTIAAGRAGSAPYPIFDETGKVMGYRRILTDIDEDALKRIAKETGGQYFRADSTETIASAFKAINNGQKNRFEGQKLRPREEMSWLATPAFILLFLGGLIAFTPWKQEVTT
jgi:Ca-activated chloride channel family protein